jgi:hypothetical protein
MGRGTWTPPRPAPTGAVDVAEVTSDGWHAGGR